VPRCRGSAYAGANPTRRLLATEPDHLARIRRERAFFAKHALAGEELYWAETTPVAPRRRAMRATRLAEGAGIVRAEGRGKRVLDIGCGTASYTTPLSLQTEATLVGIDVTPETLRERAARIGPATAILVDVILLDRPHPEQGFRSCLGILRLARSHGAERLEAACDRALVINARTMTSVKSILLNRLDGRRPIHPPEAPPISHANIRGPEFFH
jgi:SAM-dependent methyltransferase